MHYEDITPADFTRFWSKVDCSAGINGCWFRPGHRHVGGYPWIWFNGRDEVGHRFAFVSILGDLPPHLPFVLHKCPGGSNARCVNPAHLAPGTPKENAEDRIREGRVLPIEEHWTHKYPERRQVGILNHQTKLSWAQIHSIEAALATGARNVDLAREHCVSQATISEIKHGHHWSQRT